MEKELGVRFAAILCEFVGVFGKAARRLLLRFLTRWNELAFHPG